MAGIVKSKINFCNCSKKSQSFNPGGDKLSSGNVDKSPYCYYGKGQCLSLTRSEIGKF